MEAKNDKVTFSEVIDHLSAELHDLRIWKKCYGDQEKDIHIQLENFGSRAGKKFSEFFELVSDISLSGTATFF